LKFFDAAQPIAVATTSGDIDFGITACTRPRTAVLRVFPFCS
jgi:hypothetical protein